MKVYIKIKVEILKVIKKYFKVRGGRGAARNCDGKSWKVKSEMRWDMWSLSPSVLNEPLPRRSSPGCRQVGWKKQSWSPHQDWRAWVPWLYLNCRKTVKEYLSDLVVIQLARAMVMGLTEQTKHRNASPAIRAFCILSCAHTRLSTDLYHSNDREAT